MSSLILMSAPNLPEKNPYLYSQAKAHWEAYAEKKIMIYDQYHSGKGDVVMPIRRRRGNTTQYIV